LEIRARLFHPEPGNRLGVMRALIAHMRTQMDIHLSLCSGVQLGTNKKFLQVFFGLLLANLELAFVAGLRPG